jgi:crotonobetainyl-CoA:carnitine CoA-transferase CaiB-like acyl-CoA transferase
VPSPLEGIRVLDFTRFQNGPHATLMLADMGAAVLKVERPGDGDPGRALGRRPDGFGGYFESFNRGKKSITLDLASDAVKPIIHRLVRDADVLTENFRPGMMESLGLGYDTMRDINPRLIYATNSGFGPVGEWTQRGSYDVVVQGMTGAMQSQGGGPGTEPVHINWGLGDQVGSMVFAYGIVTALLARERNPDGAGAKLDVSQMGALATLQALSLVGYLHSGEERGRLRNPVFTYYQDSEGDWFTVGVLTPKHWPLLCEAIDRQDLLTDERSVDAFARAEHRDWLLAQLTRTFLERPREGTRLCGSGSGAPVLGQRISRGAGAPELPGPPHCGHADPDERDVDGTANAGTGTRAAHRGDVARPGIRLGSDHGASRPGGDLSASVIETPSDLPGATRRRTERSPRGRPTEELARAPAGRSAIGLRRDDGPEHSSARGPAAGRAVKGSAGSTSWIVGGTKSTLPRSARTTSPCVRTAHASSAQTPISSCMAVGTRR